VLVAVVLSSGAGVNGESEDIHGNDTIKKKQPNLNPF
jgi:hypothetical protein